MKIFSIQIKNYKNLKDVTLNDLGNMVVVIGKNSAGKSNLLEAICMFFSCFNLIEQRSVTTNHEFSEYIWYDLDTQSPIEITLGIIFDEIECEEIFPIRVLNIVKDRFPDTYAHVVLSRTLDFQTGWKTGSVTWADLQLVTDNKLVDPEDFCKTVIIPSLKATPITPLPESTAAEVIGKIARSLQERIKGAFKLAKVMRDSDERTSNLGMRTTVLNSETYAVLHFLKQSRKHEDEQRWNSVEKMFEDTSSMKLDMRGGEILARKSDLCLPLHLIGGGDQEVLVLNQFLMHKKAIVSIEEPEMHLHPRSIMRVLMLMEAISASSQVFLATHSPVIIDHVNIQNIWITRMDGKETKFIGFCHDGELSNMLQEFEIRLSDILFAEKLIIVEGLLEKVMVPIFAQKMGIDPDSFSTILIKPKLNRETRVSILFRREIRGEYNLRAWSEVSRKTGIPVFLLLHRDARKEVEALIQEGALQRLNQAFLQKGIQNYIPVNMWVSVLNEIYGLSLNAKDIDPAKSRITEINRVLPDQKRLPFGWKTRIAKEIAERIPVKTIPDEIKMLFASMRMSS